MSLKYSVCVHITHTPPPSFLFCVFPLCALVQTGFLHLLRVRVWSWSDLPIRTVRIILKNVSASDNGAHTHRYTLHAWKQPVLSVRSKLPPLWLECSWRDRREDKRWSARGAISYTFTEATGRSITNTRPRPPALTSHISCLAPARSKSQTGEKKKKASNFEFISRCLKTQNKSPCDITAPNRKWLKRWKDEIKMAHAGLLFYIFHY